MTTPVSGTPQSRVDYKPNKQLGVYFKTEEDLSLADKIAELTEEQRELVLADPNIDMEALVYDRSFWLRPSQLTAVNSKQKLTVCLAGRGWGKTRVLSETVQKYAMEHPNHVMIILGRTTSDVRDVIILGDSGIMAIAHPDERPEYKPQIRRLIWKNGAQAMLFSAERPDSLRGVQAHFAACDEIAAYRNNPGSGLANAFDQVRIATRLPTEDGINQIVVATTPKRTPIVLNILKEAEEHPEQVLIIRGSTYANRHLSKDYQETVTNLYAGTTLGKQELEGELLVDVEGALLQQATIDLHRTIQYAPSLDSEFWKKLPNRAIGIDPSVAANPNDECGIIAMGATGERKMYLRHGYVLEDASVLGSPEVWAKRAIEMARKYRAPIIAESNQGGEMVRMIIKGYDERVPVLLVHAKLSKFQRAEPVAAMYQRGRVHHCDWYEMLESQWTGWAPGQGLASPDRMDATVHAATALMIKEPKGLTRQIEIAATANDRHLDTVMDHDPFTGSLANTRHGTSGLTDEQIRERLRIATNVRESDLNTHREDRASAQARRANRSGRLPLSVNGSPRTAISAKLYGPPNRFSR